MDPFDALATTANVSLSDAVTGAELRQVFLTGEMPDRLSAHVGSILQEAPFAMLLRAITACRREEDVNIVPHLQALAGRVGAAERIDGWVAG